MELTSENKAHIDGLTHAQLLTWWRNAPAGDPWFQGATGDYWQDRMAEKRDEDPGAAVANSKRIGW